MMNRSNEADNYSRKWIEIDRSLFPDKELMKNLSAPEFKALTLLVSVLMNSKKCFVSKGVISVNYSEKVSIHLHIMETIANKVRETEFDSRWNQHLKVTVRDRVNSNRPPLNVCIVTESEGFPVLDYAASFVLMAESNFCSMPSTLANAIEDVQLTVLELKAKQKQEDERRRIERARQKALFQEELAEKRRLNFDFDCQKTRINSLTWRELLEEHHRDLTPTGLLQEMISEYRSKLIGEV